MSYRHFKLSAALCPAATVATSATVSVQAPQSVATVATVACTNAQKQESIPPEPDEVEIEERKAMSMDSVPEPYLDGWARLQVQKPLRVSDAEWRQAIDDAGRFLDQWGSLALEFGWTPGDLFEVPRGDAMGLVWWLKSRTVTALGPEHASVGQ